MSIELSAPEVEKLKPRLALLGIGGGGGNALRTMIDSGLKKKARQNKALVDEVSATIILQSFMEQQNFKC